jgi:DNA-binding PadR family transcriptional regulator
VTEQNLSERSINDVIQDFSRLFTLMILYEGPSHGYSILRKFKTRLGKTISPGFVYPFLQELDERGLIAYEVTATGERERKLYSLTDEGKEFCNRLFRRFADLVSAAIEPTLDVCSNCGCKLFKGGYSEIIHGKEMRFCCVHCARAYKLEKELPHETSSSQKIGFEGTN